MFVKNKKRLKRKKVFKLAHTPYIYTLQQGKIFHHTLLAICVGSSNLQLVIFLSIALFAIIFTLDSYGEMGNPRIIVALSTGIECLYKI